MSMRISVRLAAVTLAAALSGAAPAADLRIGLSSEVTTLDPHFFNLVANVEFNHHVFDYLVDVDEKTQLVPSLAESWRNVDELTWEFKLRRGVRFHDGTPFTADDVVFTFQRAPNVPNSPASYGQYLKRISAMTVVDEHTLRISTAAPYAALLHELSNVGIVSRKNGENAKTVDYNSGKATIGTGPYKLVEWVQGDRLVLVRNDDYWGAKPNWDRVVFKPITNNAARTAALLAGDVELINNVSSTDVDVLRRNAGLVLAQGPGLRLYNLSIDSNRDISPFVADKEGRPMTTNPLKDVRVRRAISKAINREALASQIMEGQAIPASQYLPPPLAATSPRLKPDAFDLDGARKLLAEAGYPDGFSLTVHGPNDRYPNDAKVVQALAAMLTRAGIKSSADAMSRTIFFTRAAKLEFSAAFAGTATDTGEVMDMLKYMSRTYDEAKGVGNGNRGRWSNPRFDDLVERAYGTLDAEKRNALVIEATENAMDQVALVPLYWPINTWAMRKGLSYVARPDEYTLATAVKPAP